jgi:acetyltransferase-like isoleucine patch superfamily enzyme/glycosyltransferase involved in cell wall biosynthesis
MTKILTIGIPTYNRADTLDLALASLANQAPEALAQVQLLVSNNASTDNTREVVERYRHQFPHFEYVENATNMGMDFNMAQAFRLAKTKYSWIFSDDDLLLPDQLSNIVGILQQEEIGSLFLQPTWYREQLADASIGDNRLAYKRFDDPLEYLAQVYYWVVFITSNIVNKDLVQSLPALYQFDGTLMVHLGWTVPVIFRGKPSVRITSSTVVGRATESVSYRFFDTHGRVLMNTLDRMVQQQLIPPAACKIIADKLLTEFFPQYVAPGIKVKNNEKPWVMLFRTFWPYQTFWSSFVPLLMRRLAHPVTGPVKRKAKRTAIRVLDKMMSVTENARAQRLTDQLGGIGLNSHLPVQTSIVNPQYVFIGRRLQAGHGLKIEVRPEDTRQASPCVSIGDDVTLGSDVLISCAQEVSIGNHVQLGNRVCIIDHAPDQSEAARQLLPAQRPLRSYGPVRIGARALLEDGVWIIGGVTIGEGAVVMAGTVVRCDVEPYTVVGEQALPQADKEELMCVVAPASPLRTNAIADS